MALDTARAQVILNTLTAKFDNRAKSVTPLYPQFCTELPSNRDTETYGMIGNFPGMREWLGDRKFKELLAARFSIQNKLWESSLLIEKTNLADDHMGLYPSLMEELGAEAVAHPDELVIDSLVNGESTECFDGQYFFDTDHSWGDSGDQDNDLGATVADTGDITAAEIRDAYHAARLKLMTYKNDQGKFMNRSTISQAGSLIWLIPPKLQRRSVEALDTPQWWPVAAAEGSQTNVVLDRPRIVTSPLLTSEVKGYLINSGAPLRPIIFQRRAPLERGMKGLDDLEVKDVKFMTQARYNVGYGAWWTAVLTTFAT
jgi:phage major head subunit gpT-like protein